MNVKNVNQSNLLKWKCQVDDGVRPLKGHIEIITVSVSFMFYQEIKHLSFLKKQTKTKPETIIWQGMTETKGLIYWGSKYNKIHKGGKYYKIKQEVN